MTTMISPLTLTMPDKKVELSAISFTCGRLGIEHESFWEGEILTLECSLDNEPFQVRHNYKTNESSAIYKGNMSHPHIMFNKTICLDATSHDRLSTIGIKSAIKKVYKIIKEDYEDHILERFHELNYCYLKKTINKTSWSEDQEYFMSACSTHIFTEESWKMGLLPLNIDRAYATKLRTLELEYDGSFFPSSFMDTDVMFKGKPLNTLYVLVYKTYKKYFYKDKKGKVFLCKSVDKETIFKRGGTIKSEKVTLIGFGSLGSFMFKKLIREGYSNFNVFDASAYTLNNAIRHEGVHNYSDLPKADISKNIARFLHPWCKVEPHGFFLYEKYDLDCDILIDTTGEFDYVSKHLADTKTKPKIILSIWMEPSGKGAHMIISSIGNYKDYINQYVSNFQKIKYETNEEAKLDMFEGCLNPTSIYSQNDLVALISIISQGFEDKEGIYSVSIEALKECVGKWEQK